MIGNHSTLHRTATAAVMVCGLFAGTAVAQHPAEEPGDIQEERFEPVRYQRNRTIHLDGPPEDVFRLFTPSGFEEWSRRQTPPDRQVLFEGRGEDDWTAYMSRVLTPHNTRWNVVAEHDPESMVIRYVLVIPEVELLVHEIQCLPNPRGGTIAVITWECAGLSPDGNVQVSEFFDGGHFERQIDGWETSLNDYLAKRSE